MNFIEQLKVSKPIYTKFYLSQNPFKIEPLFRDFRDKEFCERQESLFVLPFSCKSHIRSLCHLKDRRCLIYGGYGVGKTSLIDLILYLNYNYHKRFCLRVIVTEDNVERAINEMLLSLCTEIIDHLSSKSLSHPVQSIQKWLIEKKLGDSLLGSMAQLIGRYSEEKIDITKKRKKTSLEGKPIGLGIGREVEYEIETRKTIQSYVDILPMRSVGDYMSDMLEIVKKMGYQDIIVFIDEADHLGKIDSFLRMLTKAREVLFSDGFTFFIAGSPEIARHVESIGIIFDKTLFLEPATYEEFKEVLTHRIHLENKKLKINDIFTEEALKLIHNSTKGIRKQFIRIAENAMDIALEEANTSINEYHVMEAINMGQDRIQITLSDSQIKVMQCLAKLDSSSPSSKQLQQGVNVKREALRLLLEDLLKQGYVKKEKKGRTSIYSITSTYKPYFLMH